MSFTFLTGDTDGVVYVGAPDGSLIFYKDEARDGTPRWANAGSGQVIGSGWENFPKAFTAGDGVIYATAPNGDLLFFQDLARDGNSDWAHAGTAQRIGVGWEGFTHILSGDDGVIYGVLPGGELMFFKDRARNGLSDWDVSSGNIIGSGWDAFTRVLPGGSGVIYAIDAAGRMLWFKDQARDGTVDWHPDSGSAIGSGWEIFVDVISAGDGIFYAITPDGFMLFFKDLARDGTVDWAFNGAGVTLGGGWTATPTKPVSVSGYPIPLSVAPGRKVAFHVSALAPYDVTIQRLKQQPGGEPGIDIEQLPRQAGTARAVPALAWREGCGWPESFTFTVPTDAKSGVYSARCTTTSGDVTHICFVVRPKSDRTRRHRRAREHQHLVLLQRVRWPLQVLRPDQARSSASNAPNPNITPLAPNVIDHLLRAELWLLNWLEDEGYSLDVYSDLDFHKGVTGFNQYKALIISTHPEYWTGPMLDHLENYLGAGGSLLYLGGNGVFEQVEIDEDKHILTHSTGDPSISRDAFYFRNLDPPRSERATLGVAYRFDNYMTFAPYQVLQAGHRLFQGTGLSNGDLIGEHGINGNGASGWEMDTAIPGLVPPGTVVSATGPDDRGAPPANLEIIARGTNPGFGADMTCYDHPAGGRVFSVGSISFVGSMIGDDALQQIVRNVLAECGATV